MDIQSKCVQAGYEPKNGEPRVLPLYQSTTYVYDTPEQLANLFNLSEAGHIYTRISNPTVCAFEDKMNALEGGVGALACASGLAAETLAVLNVCNAGDNIVSLSTVYGGTYNLFNVTLRKYGINTTFIEPTATKEDILSLIDDNTKILYCETIANPSMHIVDFDMMSSIAKEKGILLFVDNTLATPLVCKPIEYGANIVIYSTSKYIDGHASCIGGMIIDGGNFDFAGNPRYPEFNKPDESYHGLVYTNCAPASFVTKARVQMMRDLGCCMSPFNAYLTNIGAETLHLRMAKHGENAMACAEMLEAHPNVEWVKFNGLESDDNYNKARKYFREGYNSGMIAFGVKGGLAEANTFMSSLKLAKIVTHIADARTSVIHPATTTHRQLSGEQLIACGITENLVRLSVGIECSADIIRDLERALDNIN